MVSIQSNASDCVVTADCGDSPGLNNCSRLAVRIVDWHSGIPVS